MRMRAFRPEVSGCLEGRLLLSGVAGQSAAPFVLLNHNYKLFVAHVVAGFTLYARYHDRDQLENDIHDVLQFIPYAHADGLPAKVDGIVDEMVNEVRAGVPHAIRTAANDVFAVTRAEVLARVQAGDVVVR